MIPTLEKTWSFNVNQVIPVGSTYLLSCQAQLQAIKNSLVTAGWTVVGSSNGTAAALDGVDRLTTAANWTWPSNGSVPNAAAGWIVLKNTGIASNFQLLIYSGQTGGTSGQMGYISISHSAGFTLAGTATFKPTATDEVAVRTNAIITGCNATTSVGFQSVVHVMYTTDLKCWRVLMHNNGVQRGFVLIDTVADPVTGWTPAVAATWVGTTAGPNTTYANYNDVSTYLLGRITAVNVNLYMTSESLVSSMIGEYFPYIPNEVDGLWPICPIGLASLTATRTGRHGRLQDIYWGSTSGILIEGSTYPNDGSRQFIHTGHMVLPWNGSFPIIS